MKKGKLNEDTASERELKAGNSIDRIESSRDAAGARAGAGRGRAVVLSVCRWHANSAATNLTGGHRSNHANTTTAAVTAHSTDSQTNTDTKIPAVSARLQSSPIYNTGCHY